MKNIWRTFNNLHFKNHWNNFNRMWQKAKGLQVCLNLKEHNANYSDVTSTTLFSKTTAAVTWLKYCRYGIKLYPINQPKTTEAIYAKVSGLISYGVCSILMDQQSRRLNVFQS